MPCKSEKKTKKKTWQITKGRNTPKQTNANGRRRQRTNDQTNEWRERIKLVHCAININNINVNKYIYIYIHLFLLISFHVPPPQHVHLRSCSFKIRFKRKIYIHMSIPFYFPYFFLKKIYSPSFPP